MLSLLAAGFVFGLAFNAAPGPVTAETLRRGLRGGFGPALAVQVGSLAGDLGWAVLGLAGAGAAFSVPALRAPLEAAGAALLGWMAWGAFRDAQAGGGFASAEGGATGAARRGAARGGALAAGAALSLSNPGNVVFWAAVAAPMAALGAEEALSAQAGAFLAGFAAACVVWCVLMAGLVAWARRLLTPGLHRALHLACALALAAFALLSAWGAWRAVVPPPLG